MHRGYRKGKLLDLLNPGSHLRILADETGRAVITTYSFRHSGQRTISLDHIAHGTPWMLLSSDSWKEYFEFCRTS